MPGYVREGCLSVDSTGTLLGDEDTLFQLSSVVWSRLLPVDKER